MIQHAEVQARGRISARPSLKVATVTEAASMSVNKPLQSPTAFGTDASSMQMQVGGRSEGGYARGAAGPGEISVLPFQFCRDPETALFKSEKPSYRTGVGNIQPTGPLRAAKSFVLALPRRPQEGLEIQSICSRLFLH